MYTICPASSLKNITWYWYTVLVVTRAEAKEISPAHESGHAGTRLTTSLPLPEGDAPSYRKWHGRGATSSRTQESSLTRSTLAKWVGWGRPDKRDVITIQYHQCPCYHQCLATWCARYWAVATNGLSKITCRSRHPGHLWPKVQNSYAPPCCTYDGRVSVATDPAASRASVQRQLHH
jgi:hypothetical protein